MEKNCETVPRRITSWQRHLGLKLVGSLFLSLQAAQAAGQPLPSIQPGAGKLQQAIVTVRITLYDSPQSDAAKPVTRLPRVTVCSGISLGKGLIVTSAYAAADSKIRITLPGGVQSDAQVRVIDEYSGLLLLDTGRIELPGIELADADPQVGSWVLGAAAWGQEAPVLSIGIVSGINRTVAETRFPPMLQCDLRATETTGGAAIANHQGQLVGVAVLAGREPGLRGWTYAVPVRHVQRLLRTRKKNARAGQVTVLKRRRPVVGMVLDGQGEKVVVSKVEDQRPASRAGIQRGDQILAVDGLRIRSVYQALRPILFRQPGDKVEFLIENEQGQRAVQVVLGGELELESAHLENLSKYVRPKIDIEVLGPGYYRAQSGHAVREVFAPNSTPEQQSDEKELTNGEKIELLQKTLDRYRTAIQYLQKRLDESELDRTRAQRLIDSLREDLRKSQTPSKKDPTSKTPENGPA